MAHVVIDSFNTCELKIVSRQSTNQNYKLSTERNFLDKANKKQTNHRITTRQCEFIRTKKKSFFFVSGVWVCENKWNNGVKMVKTGPKIRWENYSNPLKNRFCALAFICSSWQGLRSPVSLIHWTLNWWLFFYSLFMYHILWAATFLSNTKAFIQHHLNNVWQTFDSKIESFSHLFAFPFPRLLGLLRLLRLLRFHFMHWLLIVSKPFPFQ